MTETPMLGLKDAKYKAAIDFTEGVVLLNSFGVVVDANKRYCKIYGLDTERFGKIDYGSTLEIDSKNAFMEKFEACKNDKKVFKVKLRKKNFNSSISIIEATGVPFFDAEGLLSEVLLLIVDATQDELIHRKKVLELLKQRQVALDKMRDSNQKSNEQISNLQAELEADKVKLKALIKELKAKQTKIDLIAIRVHEAQLSLSFDNALAAEIHRSKRYKRPLCILLFGLDRMESLLLLDSHDHDRALVLFYNVVRDFVRLCDMLFLDKKNSTTFMMLLPETSSDGASRLCEKLQEHLSKTMPSVFGRKVTCSFVIVEFNESSENHSETLERARDAFQALGESKKRGEIVLFSETLATPEKQVRETEFQVKEDGQWGKINNQALDVDLPNINTGKSD